MVKRVKQVTVWLIGLGILVFLIQYPIQKHETTWKSWSLPLSGQTIVIDPGHGGPDGGAQGADKTQEKDIALEVSKKLRDRSEEHTSELQARGHLVCRPT